MSSRRPHLRNRKRIKGPRRFDDADVTTSPRQESHEESEESSELEEEIYNSPKFKTCAYRGKVTAFNPDLPPAAFPTLDHPDYVHNGGNIPVDLESNLLGWQSREPSLAGSEIINSDSVDGSDYREEIKLLGDFPAMPSTASDLTRRGSQSVIQTSIRAQKRPQTSMPSGIYGGPTDNGPRNWIWVSNMARMKEAGRMSELDRNMLELESSDEEVAAVESKKLTKTPSVPEIPAWDDLTVAHKLDLADAVGEFRPDPAEVMYRLRLGPAQKKDLTELLIQRQDRAAREEKDRQTLQEQTKDILLQGRRLSQSAFHQMAEENLYGSVHEDDHRQTNLKELKKARAYLDYYGFNPALANDSWDVPVISNAASSTKRRPAQSKTEAILSSTAAQTPPSPAKGPFARPPALPPQRPSYPPDPRLGLLQQHAQGAFHQHRPTPNHPLIAQHSPGAPLSKVPIQSYRVAPGSQSGDLAARYESTAHIPQPTIPPLPGQPSAPTGPDLLAINNAPLKGNGASSVLPKPQEKHSLRVEIHSSAPKGLCTARNGQKRQSSRIPNAGASALQETARVVESGDSVNKKRRKKKAT